VKNQEKEIKHLETRGWITLSKRQGTAGLNWMQLLPWIQSTITSKKDSKNKVQAYRAESPAE